MRVALVSVFPDMLAAVRDHGVTSRAVKDGRLELLGVNPRDYTRDRHRSVDDRPYGGGPGMVMRPEPLRDAIKAGRDAAGPGPVLYMSPQGRRFDDAWARKLAELPGLILVAGRYEGVDERLISTEVDGELSIGDYVLSGGELAALVVIDALARWIPGVLGHDASAAQDSFAGGLLDCPHYTRPEEFSGHRVPEVLMSGDHAAIERWRRKQALGRTADRRPDLLERLACNGELDAADRALLQEYAVEGQQLPHAEQGGWTRTEREPEDERGSGN
ncbi:MAG: tRNA (guanosine(37)-N1)-methyltransferase TrmD [Pseudomonadota bacterium]